MAENNNATCSICGKGYNRCLSCKSEMSAKPWKVHTCSSEHYKILQIIRGFHNDVYSKTEAKSKLENVDLSDMNTFRYNVKNTIKDIMKQDVVKQYVNADVEQEQQNDVQPVEQEVNMVYKNRRKKISEVGKTE